MKSSCGKWDCQEASKAAVDVPSFACTHSEPLVVCRSGTMGSESATSAFKALEQKIHNFAGQHSSY